MPDLAHHLYSTQWRRQDLVHCDAWGIKLHEHYLRKDRRERIQIYLELEMWANAQPDGRPAEYRWRPLLNAAVWLTPSTRVPCSNAAKTRNPMTLAGVPQTNETISAASRPKFTVLWRHLEEILLLNKFFSRLSIHAVVAKI